MLCGTTLQTLILLLVIWNTDWEAEVTKNATHPALHNDILTVICWCRLRKPANGSVRGLGNAGFNNVLLPMMTSRKRSECDATAIKFCFSWKKTSQMMACSRIPEISDLYRRVLCTTPFHCQVHEQSHACHSIVTQSKYTIPLFIFFPVQNIRHKRALSYIAHKVDFIIHQQKTNKLIFERNKP